jgi:hypothetical protein
MDIRKVVRPIGAAMIVATLAACMSSPRGAQESQGEPADFTAAQQAEVRDAQGRVVLRGTFAVNQEDDDDVERKAPLTPTDIDADATGEAEVEISGTGNGRRQEVEFAVNNVQAGGVFTFLIDGKVFGTATADAKGRAAHERDVPLPTR